MYTKNKTVKLIRNLFVCSLNRRRDDEGEVKTEELELDRVGLENDNDISQYYETISIHTESSNTNASKGKTSDSITRIFACATMWHETKSEMMEMLKSLFRLVNLQQWMSKNGTSENWKMPKLGQNLVPFSVKSWTILNFSTKRS